MSLTFTNICSIIDDNCGTDSTSYPVASKTRNVNLGIDNLMLMLFGQGAGGTWQLDDYNHTKDPIITTNLVLGQRDYHFTTDEQGNIILDIYKVQVKDQNGAFYDLIPVNQQDESAPKTMTDGQETTGTPKYYDKTGNGIFLDLVPSYNSTGGLKMFVNREASYFTASDTTKKLGFTGIYHEYLVLYSSYLFARAKGLENREAFKRDLTELEEKIKRHAGTRTRDEKRRLVPVVQNNK